jgi:murein DD-endopeptidase MepM/ murein hydrolase activator NlpD
MTISVSAVAVGAIVAFQIGPRISSSAHVPAPPREVPPVAVEVTPNPMPPAVPTAALVAEGAATVTVEAPLVPERVAIAPVVTPGTFVHPLPGPTRHMPLSHDREFGAARPGDRDPECGAGHCGVDLGRDIGTPVLAVRGGTVGRVVRDPDNRGGLWVQIKHPDGLTSYYMHLDRVRSDLELGVAVSAGEPIGTLGRSGIHNSAPHLHFAMSTMDDAGETHFDPLPLLRDAAVIDPPPVYHDPADDAAQVAPTIH